MMLRWISLVPPAIDRARLPRKPPIHAAPSPSSTAASGPSNVEPDLLHALLVLDADQLADARLGAGLGRRRGPATSCAAPSAAMRVGVDQQTRRAGRPPAVVEPAPASAMSSTASTPGPNVEPSAIDTRSLASVVRAASQPSFAAADHALVGHEHVVEEDLVEHSAIPVSSRSGRMSMPGVFMSTRKQLMPSCFGASGSVRARQMRPVGTRGHRRPDLLAGDRPPAVDPRSRRGAATARSLPAPGSLNIWHQRSRRASRARSSGPAGRRCRGAISVGSTQAPTCRCGRRTRRRASSSSMTSCSTATRRGPTGCGQCGTR